MALIHTQSTHTWRHLEVFGPYKDRDCSVQADGTVPHSRLRRICENQDNVEFNEVL
jgi:DNA repair photolyase